VGFDGSGLRLLTPEDAYHEIEGQISAFTTYFFGAGPRPSRISPDLRFLVDTWSTANQPPVSVLRSAVDGGKIATLEEADASALYDLGWQAPERFTVKAADGDTDLYGIILFPSTFDPSKKYPVINAFYGGPQVSAVPNTFVSNAVEGMGRRSLAELGFTVVTVDSRGTVYRSKAFHDYSYLNVGEYGLEDQIGAIRQLASRFPAMDLDRVGIYGHSFGGYGSARAILAHPDFFKVAVSSAGVHNFASIYHGFEIMMGIPDYGDGRTVAFDSLEFPENYRPVDNRALAANLKGHLLIAWGEIDENVPPNTLVQLVDALIKADKSFDVIYMPNANHGFAGDAWFIHRRWDYFVEHLMGADPPGN
jgi:dipeptidyl aminopeptidase/acylaminoacyl peptidase